MIYKYVICLIFAVVTLILMYESSILKTVLMVYLHPMILKLGPSSSKNSKVYLTTITRAQGGVKQI
jgi:hypothetical protein